MRPEHPHHLQSLELGREIANLLDCTTWSGAGPGLMDAVTKGALEAGKPVGGFKIGKEAGEWTASNYHPYLPSETYLTCSTNSVGKDWFSSSEVIVRIEVLSPMERLHRYGRSATTISEALSYLADFYDLPPTDKRKQESEWRSIRTSLVYSSPILADTAKVQVLKMPSGEWNAELVRFFMHHERPFEGYLESGIFVKLGFIGKFVVNCEGRKESLGMAIGRVGSEMVQERNVGRSRRDVWRLSSGIDGRCRCLIDVVMTFVVARIVFNAGIRIVVIPALSFGEAFCGVEACWMPGLDKGLAMGLRCLSTMIDGSFVRRHSEFIRLRFLLIQLRKVHDSVSVDEGDVFPWASSFLEEFKRANDKGLMKARTVVTKPSPRRTPPADREFKLNVDAAVDSDRGRVGIGIIIRDQAGDVLASSAKRNELKRIIRRRTLLDRSLACNVGFVPKEAHTAALSVAKLGLNVASDCFWLEECPSSVAPIVMANCLVLM
ncbi:hypothetical protein Ddye_027670 [Dipteronia dyeriana]|uniref:RNase H type-1 domain-containing protein n=1 Tax=Dipteronia dyeriana TaxID=168575 RepID=A0AAD9TPJ9_9ROSI|nr:hypothetical protein Ddye_027670 [Dipteronia dyeriana]